MAINAKGTNVGFEGWVLTSKVKQGSGEVTRTYQGNSSTADLFIAHLKRVSTDTDENTSYFDSISVTEDPASGIATVTTITGASTEIAKERPPEDETQMPTCVIQGTMLSPPLHQCTGFDTKTETTDGEGETVTESSPLTLEEIRTVEMCLRNKGIVTTKDVERAQAQLYARWRMFGVDTFLAPSYTMTITRYLSVAKKNAVNAYIQTPSKVWKFDTVVASLPSAVKPVSIGVPAWLAQAPTINYTKDGITVVQTFLGAQSFPSFYEAEDNTLVHEPPAMPTTYADETSVNPTVTSGEED